MIRMVRISLVVCVLVSVIFIEGGAFAQSTRRIVVFKPETTLAQAQGVVENVANMLPILPKINIDEVHNLMPLINALTIEYPPILPGVVEILLSLLTSNPLVEGVYDDTVAIVDGGSHCVSIVPALLEDVPVPERYPWGLQMIGVPAVHQPPPTGPGLEGLGVTVAILDTGINASHPELSGRVIDGYNARAGAIPSAWQDNNGHGTHMAGIIAANRNNPFPGPIGIVGVAYQATLLPVKVLDRYGAGYLSDFINGLQWVYNNGTPLAKVVNMSIGFPDSQPLKKAIVQLNTKGAIMVASAGNRCPQPPAQDEGNGDDCDGGPQLACDPAQTAVKYPAAYPEVLAVVATDVFNHITAYSRSGTTVDVAAPGGSKETEMRILSTTIGNGYGYGSGTSQAAAHVTGAVALALELNSSLSFQQVRSLLQATAVELIDPLTGQPYPAARQGAGLINVDNMVP